MLVLLKVPEEHIEAVFQFFDDSKDGYLSFEGMFQIA
jgi:Ca2+-binding EF-hand superfamily protein